jgi:transposase-like protein
MVVERLKSCDNIVALAQELGLHRRLLYKWRDQLEPVTHGEPAPSTPELRQQSAAVEATSGREGDGGGFANRPEMRVPRILTHDDCYACANHGTESLRLRQCETPRDS